MKEEEKMKEEEEISEERKRQYKSEKEEFLEWRDSVLLIDNGEILNLLLFKINENLDYLSESIEYIKTKL
ncbi:hypothetical protein ES695_05560 [Candidatus Atribacteria bacterium 1244-E10-H5-B2]|nr:MAG: hypothetical protein ES695_05560 [Candidatus Atribacteria bacterium 1244-E10-H5-B2]